MWEINKHKITMNMFYLQADYPLVVAHYCQSRITSFTQWTLIFSINLYFLGYDFLRRLEIYCVYSLMFVDKRNYKRISDENNTSVVGLSWKKYKSEMRIARDRSAHG